MMRLSFVLLCLLLTITAAAQDTCTTQVADALALVDQSCEDMGRNELCYGNTSVSVTGLDEGAAFSQPGDVVSILDIASVRTGPYAEPDEWGIAVMQVQANLPDTLPGANVTFLLFGEGEVRNAGSPVVSLSASTAGGLNVRGGPSTNFAVVGGVQANETVDLIGRNVAGDWVYFVTGEQSGWLFASLLQIEGDVMTLDEVPNDFEGGSPYAPMQAVYFSSGIAESTCRELPHDGILIQTPDYPQPIELIVNDVEIRLSSTAYLQAEAGNEMVIYLVEGFAFVTSNGVTVNLPAGAETRIPIDDQLRATGTPSPPASYVPQDVTAAPVSVLPDAISVATPAAPELLSAAGQPIVGNWVASQPDGSLLTATIIAVGGNRYTETFTDTQSAPDGPCAGTGYVGQAEGAFSDNVLQLDTGLIVCDNGNTHTDYRPLIYDPVADTLTVQGVNIVYRRQ